VAYFDTIYIFAWRDRKFNISTPKVPVEWMALLPYDPRFKSRPPEASIEVGVSRGFRYFAHANTGNYVTATS
jgi:hypothetical protein